MEIHEKNIIKAGEMTSKNTHAILNHLSVVISSLEFVQLCWDEFLEKSKENIPEEKRLLFEEIPDAIESGLYGADDIEKVIISWRNIYYNLPEKEN